MTRIYEVASNTEVLAIATHGDTLAVAHREATVTLRDAANGALQARLSSSSPVFALEFARDGSFLLAARGRVGSTSAAARRVHHG